MSAKAAVIIPILFLAACGHAQPAAELTFRATCLPMAEYTREQQIEVAGALEGPLKGTTPGRFIVDYGVLRSANRAACAPR